LKWGGVFPEVSAGLYLQAFQGVRGVLPDRSFGAHFAIPHADSNCVGEDLKMGILILKIMGSWSLVALVGGLCMGAIIRRGDRVRKDEFLSCVFATLENLEAYRS